MTIEELTKFARDFLASTYGLSIEIPIVRNNRLRTAMGRYISTWKDDAPDRIEIAGFVFDYADPSVIVDTLKHECVHYALHVKGEPNNDGHPHFESELSRLKVSATGTNRVGVYVVYECVKCGKIAETRGKRLLKDHQYCVTWCCRAKIRINGERIYNGTEALS